MGRTSAGLHERDADCGIELRDRTTRRIRRKTLVHYLVSPPHCPETGQRQAKAIPVILQAADALAACVHPSHIVIYAPGNSRPCRLPAT
ncbi:TPA: hypothetical protein L9968_002682 [Klebsiella aerogenes]|nr:hypothetical protein [Klebsiella aerogenes]ELA0416674.1 hypothetical protein [Klebsiella aerogenes]ELA1688672.1 hypothetical protein [Klebsiella aerogenes]ELW9544891.1 hypothetical protein [Klebsiella aerogenes]EMF0802906.1 hypothetical protein [Klebsiella aerogenes]